MWKCRKFSHHFCSVLMWSPKKKVITPMEASFSPILCWSPKKKGSLSKFCNFSMRFLRHTRARRREPRLSTVFGGKQKRRFLVGEKTLEFAKFQCENAGKNFALFALFCAYKEHCCQHQTLNFHTCQNFRFSAEISGCWNYPTSLKLVYLAYT